MIHGEIINFRQNRQGSIVERQKRLVTQNPPFPVHNLYIQAGHNVTEISQEQDRIPTVASIKHLPAFSAKIIVLIDLPCIDCYRSLRICGHDTINLVSTIRMGDPPFVRYLLDKWIRIQVLLCLFGCQKACHTFLQIQRSTQKSNRTDTAIFLCFFPQLLPFFSLSDQRLGD